MRRRNENLGIYEDIILHVQCERSDEKNNFAERLDRLLSLVRGDRPRPSLLAQPLLFMLFNPPYKHVSSHVHTHTTNSYSLHTHLPRRRCLLPATPLPRRRFNTRDPNSG